MKHRVKVKVEDLKIGMYVAELDRPWLETSFLFKGFVIGSQKDIKVVKESCEYVYVDLERSTTQFVESKTEPRSMAHRASLRKSGRNAIEQRAHSAQFEEEILKVRDIHHQAKTHIQHMFEDARTGRTVDTGGARQIVDGLVGSIFRNPDPLMWMAQLKNRDEYTAQHSLNVCILTLSFARYLGMDEANMKEIGLGAFMHDIGKLRVPAGILNKPDKLTAGEFELMKKHPQYGRDLLSRSGGVPSSTLDIAYSHHERAIGQGYPRGIKGEAVSQFARIVAIVDVYDAISSDRIYHRGLSAVDATKKIYELRSGSLDGKLVELFIQALGVYPVGSVVELNSGELAIVLGAEPDSRLQPKVLVVTNAEKHQTLPHRFVDLAGETERTAGGLAVRRLASPADYDLCIGMIAGGHRTLPV